MIRQLCLEHGGEIRPYRDLSRPAQLAMAFYMAVNGAAWDLPDRFNRWDGKWMKASHDAAAQAKMFRQALPHFIAHYGHREFGHVEVPMDVLKESLMKCSGDLRDHFATFEAYHRWYVSERPMPLHSRRNPWPVILDEVGPQLFQDGWHRFHRYVQLELRTVACLWYPS